jgi:DNA-binding NarL/FixJ family response regulator
MIRSSCDDPLRQLTLREQEVLALIAGGRSNANIATLVVSDGAVEKHVVSIFAKLGLPRDNEQHDRVLAVPAYLRD